MTKSLNKIVKSSQIMVFRNRWIVCEYDFFFIIPVKQKNNSPYFNMAEMHLCVLKERLRYQLSKLL